MYPPDEPAPTPDGTPASHPDEAAAVPPSGSEGLYAPAELSYPTEGDYYADAGFAPANPEEGAPDFSSEYVYAAPPVDGLAAAPPVEYEYVPVTEGEVIDPAAGYEYFAPVEEGYLPPPAPGESAPSAGEPFPVLEPESLHAAPELAVEALALPVYEPLEHEFTYAPPVDDPAQPSAEDSIPDMPPPELASVREDTLPLAPVPIFAPEPAPVVSSPSLPPPPLLPDEEVALLCEGLERFLGEAESRVHVLRGVSLRLEPGYVHAVVGPSGCGKSSLLYILGLLDRPDAGRLVISGRPVANLPDDELSRQRNALLGFIFQFHFLLQDFTALENIMIPMRQLGNRNEAEMRDRAHFLLDAVGLGEKSHRPSRHLSGGEQQRVAIARALANDPQVILADEPTGNLDTANSTRVFSLLTDLVHRQNKALLLVTHNPTIADACDWVHTMRDGQIVNQHFAGVRG